VVQSAKEFFDTLPERANGRRIEGIHSTYVFAIDGAGTWTVKVDDGKLVVDEGDQGGDCTISASEQTFGRILDGKQNPLTAYMTGKLKVKGDMGAAMKLKDILG
jgi:putative sterol carrier protein